MYAIRRCYPRREPGAQPNGEVACKFVQPHGQSAVFFPRQINFHHHRAAPGQALADTEKEIGRNNPGPGRGPDQEEWNRQRKNPTGDEQFPASVAIGQPSGEIIRQCFAQPEGRDEAEDGGLTVEQKVFRCKSRKYTPLQAYHGPDKGIHQHQESELPAVVP